jgi:NAD(P)-dependent dehydrogenase (short-subunit alcohol dehydrogenase family)
VALAESAPRILCNNAGANWPAPLADDLSDTWDKVLALHLKAVFLLTRALVPLLEEGARPGDRARVINTGSIDGIQLPDMATLAYSASRAGVHQHSRHLAKGLQGRASRLMRSRLARFRAR